MANFGMEYLSGATLAHGRPGGVPRACESLYEIEFISRPGLKDLRRDPADGAAAFVGTDDPAGIIAVGCHDGDRVACIRGGYQSRIAAGV